MKKIALLFLMLLIAITSFSGCSGENANNRQATNELTSASINIAEKSNSVIHWNEVLQKVDGFGGSSAFKKSECLMRLKEPERSELLDMIFSQEKGIGVSILRLMLGDEGNGDVEIIEPEDGVFVWDDPDWDSKKADFDKGQIWLANEAKKRGVTTFLSTAWSPPAWMKTNNDYKGNGTGELKRECYQDYADYLAEYVLGYKKHFDLDISYISIANEPGLAPEYPGCLWSADNMNLFIRDYLGPTFAAKNVKAKIVMPEDMNFDEIMALPALNDPETERYIGVVAAHAYGIGSLVPEFPVSSAKEKAIWQTEYMNQGANLQTYENNTITDALRYADLIGSMFTNTRINAYFYWWLAANNGADGSDLIRLCADGDPNSPTENGLFRVFKRYYAFGNYSRFIRPGYEMLAADSKPSQDILITAFREPKSGNFTIIAVNTSQEAKSVTLDLEGFPTDADSLIPYRTSSNENLKKLEPVDIADGSAAVELKGQSITTFISGRFELKALKDIKDVFSTFEAEENDGMSTGLTEISCPDGGKMITNIVNGSYIKYSTVNFGDGSANGTADKRTVLYMNARIAPLGGGTIEIRLDDPVSGKIVGTMNVEPSKDKDYWLTVSSSIDTNKVDGARGFHDIYVVFNNGKDAELFNVNSFSFSDAEVGGLLQ